MRPAYSAAKTTIKAAAACSNHPAIDGCKPLSSGRLSLNATRSGGQLVTVRVQQVRVRVEEILRHPAPGSVQPARVMGPA
jgi:hypothetical protein